jgi:hypothetical protein
MVLPLWILQSSSLLTFCIWNIFILQFNLFSEKFTGGALLCFPWEWGWGRENRASVWYPQATQVSLGYTIPRLHLWQMGNLPYMAGDRMLHRYLHHMDHLPHSPHLLSLVNRQRTNKYFWCRFVCLSKLHPKHSTQLLKHFTKSLCNFILNHLLLFFIYFYFHWTNYSAWIIIKQNISREIVIVKMIISLLPTILNTN